MLSRNHLSIFEVEAVRVLAPNGGESLQPGESENLRWQTFNPPRCDSLSLFYSVDNGQTYEPITTGLPGTDTSYLWAVPNVISDSCRIKIMAYGPGHQYDESDSCFSILATGIAEKHIQPIYETRLLGVFPNPTTSYSLIRFDVSKPEQVNLRLRDVSGRVVATLADGVLQPGRYSLPLDFPGLGTRSSLGTRSRFAANRVMSPGVYFLSFDASDRHETRKFVLAR